MLKMAMTTISNKLSVSDMLKMTKTDFTDKLNVSDIVEND